MLSALLCLAVWYKVIQVSLIHCNIPIFASYLTMAVTGISEGMVNHVASLYDFNLWPSREVFRIEALSETQVVAELQDIMKGRNYSWHTTNQKLQAQLENGALEFT